MNTVKQTNKPTKSLPKGGGRTMQRCKKSKVKNRKEICPFCKKANIISFFVTTEVFDREKVPEKDPKTFCQSMILQKLSGN